VLLVVASLGMPMLAVTTIAAMRDEQAQGRMLGTLLAVCVAGGLATAAVASLAGGVLAPPAPFYLRALAGILVLSACSRTVLNYFVGRQQVHRVASYSVLLSLFSLGTVVAAVYTAGLSGWVGGRYLSEILFLILLLRAVGPNLRLSGALPGGQGIGILLSAGAGIAVSLLVRTAADNAGIFLLAFGGASPTTTGYFALASLALLGLLIVPTSIGSVALPKIVARLPDPATVHPFVRRVAIGSLALSLLLAGATALLARPVIELVYPAYRDAVPVIWILLLAVPFRALSSLSGMVLVACNRVRLTVWTNVLALLVTVLAGAAAAPRWGAAGVASAVVAGEVIGAIAYVIAAWRSLPHVPSIDKVY
jgi:O-antigen/teichoic acid export membrane protein